MLLTHKNKGFTIVELLVVIVILGVLVTIGVIGYRTLTNSAVDNSVLSDLDALDGIETHYGLKSNVAGKAWYSGSPTDPDLKFVPSKGNIVDVVVNSTDYCIRIYNPQSLNYKTLSSAATKESSPGACSAIAASSEAIAVDEGLTYEAITWTQRTSAGLRAWSGVASSADGTKLAATVDGGYIYTSTDSGETWAERTTAGSRAWYSIASSADGTKLAATVDGGYIYTSTDSGATWTQRTSAGSRQWWGKIASSADGTKLVASPSWGYPLTSTDSGATWTQQTSTGYNNWRGFAMSADGTKIVGVASSNPVWVSTDTGSTWASQTVSTVQWYDATISADGSKMVISPTGNQGPIYRSIDTGSTWAALSNFSGGNCWRGLTSSGDGTKLAGASGTCGAGYIYLSKNSGTSWTQDNTMGRANWISIASSTNGSRIITAADQRYTPGVGFETNGYIYTGRYN